MLGERAPLPVDLGKIITCQWVSCKAYLQQDSNSKYTTESRL